jgi:transcriptional regulator GlxA family with amidase domain
MSKIRTQLGPKRVSFLIVPRFNMATLITMIEVMRVANYLSPQPLYAWDILSFDGADIAASNGLTLAALPPDARNRRGELVCVLASWGAEDYANRSLTAWLRRQSREGARICAVELGCYLVARAGLLAGHAATTHWSWAPGFQEQFPDQLLSEQLYTTGDQILTCAGGLAGVDLMLTLVEAAHGPVLAAEITDQMLQGAARPASAPQRRTLGQQKDTLPPVVRDAIMRIEASIAEPLGVPDLAEALGVSQRQLERQFKQAIGCTVVQFGLLLRLQHARVLLIATKLSVREIATASGFNTLSHFAFSFGRCFGRKPSEYRQGWPKGDAAPSWPGTLADFLATMQARPAAVRQKPA